MKRQLGLTMSGSLKVMIQGCMRRQATRLVCDAYTLCSVTHAASIHEKVTRIFKLRGVQQTPGNAFGKSYRSGCTARWHIQASNRFRREHMLTK